MKNLKSLISVFLALVLLVSNLPIYVHAEASDENDVQTLIEQLPDVVDPMGTEYYFYNQLSDIEKVIYWKISEATWETPEIVIANPSAYKTDLNHAAGRALSALIADNPEYHMYWGRYTSGAPNSDCFTLALSKENISSAYLIRKAESKIDEIVATVGQEGDTYTRFRELVELIIDEVDYDMSTYLIGQPKISTKTAFNDSILGPLINNYAVCGGYSHLLKVLCDRLNIPCVVAQNGEHAWNFVKMDDGQWYLTDLTIDSKAPSNDEFCNLYLRGKGEYYFIGAYVNSSGLFFGDPGEGFTFPDSQLAENAFHYNKSYVPELHDVSDSFDPGLPEFLYRVNADGNTCTIIGYEGPETGDLVIPGNIDGYTVTEIGECAFFAKDFTGSLIIADSVIGIGEGAFLYCDQFSGSLKLPSQINTIGKLAFLGCSGFTGELVLPSALRNIYSFAFFNCNGFSGDLRIPEGIEQHGDFVYTNCDGMDGTLYLPDDLVWNAQQTIGNPFQAIVVNDTNPNYRTHDGILYNKYMTVLISCPNGKSGSIVIPDGVEIISDEAFRECYQINGTLTLPNTLREIGTNAFLFCEGFTGDLIIPNSVTSIGSGAFSATGFDGKLVLSNSLTVIESSSFAVKGLTGDLVIPEGVTRIEDSAFSGAYFGGELSLPKSLEYIGPSAFAGSSSNYDTVTFSNAIDLTNTSIEISENAFMWTYMPAFRCNCNSGYTVEHRGGDHPCTGINLEYCNNCKGTQSPPLAEHTWNLADCTTPKTCSVCGETDGDPLGHDWVVDDLSDSEICKTCGATFESNPDQDWEDNTEGTDTGIGMTYNGHYYRIFSGNLSWNKAQEVCEVMGGYLVTITDQEEQDRVLEIGQDQFLWIGAKLDNNGNWMWATNEKWNYSNWRDGEPSGGGENRGMLDIGGWNDVTDAYSIVQGYICEWDDMTLVPQEFRDQLDFDTCENGHAWQSATCTDPKTCETCGATSGNAFGHNWKDATCTAAKTCKTCGATSGSALGHSWKDATCSEPKTCANCGTTSGYPLGHNWTDGNCTTPKTCTTCGTREGGVVHAYEHQYDYKCDLCGTTRTVDMTRPMVDMFRMYDPNSGEHFYTGSIEERENLVAVGWQYEGVGFTFPLTTGKPVHRLYDPVTGEHLYTMDEDEMNMLLAQGWNYEGIAFNSGFENEVPQYRLHNPNATRGAYHFTASLEERDMLIALGWEYQGIGWYSLGG